MLSYGIEDTPKLANGTMAKSNVEIIENVVRIAKEIGGNIASIEDAKKC